MNAPHETPVFGSAPQNATCHPRQAAYAVVTDPNERVAAILVSLPNEREVYWLPGGGIEPGESASDAVIREVREELGRGVEVQKKIGEAVQFFHAEDEGRWYQMKAVFFRASFDDSAAVKGESELRWIDGRSDHKLFFHACHAWAASLVSGDGSR